MSRNYSPKNFFRQAPNTSLKRYFHKQKLLKDFDFDEHRRSQVDQICEAFDALTIAQRSKIENDFRDIHALACESGMKALFREAQEEGIDLKTQFEDEELGDYEMAFKAFFDAKKVFERALLFAHAEELPPRYWKKRANLPKKLVRDLERRKNELAEALSYYFRTHEGRGYRCQIDHYRREGFDYFFAFPEDYAKTTIEWQKEGLARRQQKPAFEVIFVYAGKAATLDVFYEGSLKIVRELQAIFARAILKSELPEEKQNKPVYELNMLKAGAMEFSFEAGSGIKSVRVKRLGLAVMGGMSQKIVLEVDSSENANAIYDLLEKVVQLEGVPDCLVCKRIPMALINITHVSLQVEFEPDGKRGRNSKSFSLSYPNSCTLKHEERDLFLREMLVQWGFEKPAVVATES